MRIAVAGVSHGHSGWIFGGKATPDMEIVGIYEPALELARTFRKRNNLDSSLFYTNLEEMLDKLKPTAVITFNATVEHLSVVKSCAPRKIHVMVEKPLATTYKDALQMQKLANKHGIYLLTNYETSWYPSTELAYKLSVDSGFVGNIRKVLFHTGHNGLPNNEGTRFFFDWLTDPVKNGAGALTDFGCYGANLMTWLMKGEQPMSVSATTRQFKPDVYPKVDDEATIVVHYKTAQSIIQASWNWSVSRKEMEIHGSSGYIVARNDNLMELRNDQSKQAYTRVTNAEEQKVYTNPFNYFIDVINGDLIMPAYSPYTLENNLMVVQILDAARQSAKTGKVVKLGQK